MASKLRAAFVTEKVESLADYQNRMQNLIAINKQIHDLYRKATELTEEKVRARIEEDRLNPSGTLNQFRDRGFRYEARTFSRRLDVPWFAAWDVLGEELPPGVAPKEITFKPQAGTRRRRRGGGPIQVGAASLGNGSSTTQGIEHRDSTAAELASLTTSVSQIMKVLSGLGLQERQEPVDNAPRVETGKTAATREVDMVGTK